MADLPRMTEKQFSRAKKLLRRLCANYDHGNCLLLDDGHDPCPCPQLLTCSLVCKYFRAAVLPNDPELYEAILGNGLKCCAGCGRPFTAAAKNALYCPSCAAIQARRSKRKWAVKNRVEEAVRHDERNAHLFTQEPEQVRPAPAPAIIYPGNKNGLRVFL